ncbi:MAG: hypothetical protein ACQESG_05450, partial [Nanobdellota archaeon]
IASEWVDLSAWQEILSLIKQEYGTDEFKELHDSMAEKQFKGVLGMLAKFVSLDTLLDKAQKSWSKFYDTGSIAIEKTDENHLTAEVSGLEMTQDFAEGLGYYLAKLAEISSQKKVTPHTKTVTANTAAYEFQLES